MQTLLDELTPETCRDYPGVATKYRDSTTEKKGTLDLPQGPFPFSGARKRSVPSLQDPSRILPGVDGRPHEPNAEEEDARGFRYRRPISHDQECAGVKAITGCSGGRVHVAMWTHRIARKVRAATEEKVGGSTSSADAVPDV